MDRYIKPENEGIVAEFITPGADPTAIGFHNATFTWSQAESAPSTPGRRNFRLRIDGDLLFERGAINLIVGPTGSGKTSLLLALLGELHFTPPGPDSWFNLPRENGVAYSAQDAWILNETIKALFNHHLRLLLVNYFQRIMSYLENNLMKRDTRKVLLVVA